MLDVESDDASEEVRRRSAGLGDCVGGVETACGAISSLQPGEETQT